MSGVILFKAMGQSITTPFLIPSLRSLPVPEPNRLHKGREQGCDLLRHSLEPGLGRATSFSSEQTSPQGAGRGMAVILARV